MLHRGFVFLIVGAIVGLACEQAVAAPPAGGGNYFGIARDAAFNPGAVLPPAVTPAPAPAPEFGGPDGLLAPAPLPVTVWHGGADLGLNGASGNSELFNLRVDLNANRKTADNLFDSSFLYQYGSNAGQLTQNQAFFNARDEILFAGSPWSIFGSTNIEYDEQRAYQFRIGLYAGVGRLLIDDGFHNWRLRAGAGIVREVGRSGTASQWVPEAIFGSDYSYRVDDRQSFVFNVDYYPQIDNWSVYRVRARAAYQILLDPATGTTLKLGIQDRYDSAPANAKANDLTYFATLGFTF